MIRPSMIRQAFFVVVVVTLGCLTALAADFNGKWTADVTTPRGTQTLTFDFHVDGATVTGKISSPRGDSDITEGKIDGDNISFTQVLNFNGNEMKIVYRGKAEADGINFIRTFGDSQAVSFTAARPK